MTNEEFVKTKYPLAGTVMLNKGLYYVGSRGEEGSKMNAGERLSGQFATHNDAWADAAKRIRQGLTDPERSAFLIAIRHDPDDNTTRLVYADWLEEHDMPEEADRMRRWRASKEWLTNWVRRINYGEWERDEETDEYLHDEDGKPVPAKKDNLGNPHTFADAIEAGHSMVRGEGSHWGTDAGADFFRGGGEPVREWFQHWSTITGVEVPDDAIEEPRASCAC